MEKSYREKLEKSFKLKIYILFDIIMDKVSVEEYTEFSGRIYMDS